MIIKLPPRLKTPTNEIIKKRIYEIDDVKLVLSLYDLYRIREELELAQDDNFNNPTLEYTPTKGHFFNRKYSNIKYRVEMINDNLLELSIIHRPKSCL